MVNGRDRVRFGDVTIEYEIRRSARRKKTVQISVVGQGVRVAAPLRTPKAELREMVLKRAAWILLHTSAPPVEVQPRRFRSGETLPYLGVDLSLQVESAAVPSPTVCLEQGRLRVEMPEGLAGEEHSQRVLEAIIHWYFDRAAERFTESVDRWLPQFGREERPRMLIRDQRRRWGSCAADGTIRFNWRTVMLEPGLLDYVVVHELAHLTVMDHSPDFWGLVSQVMPDVKQRRRSLREAGGSLPL